MKNLAHQGKRNKQTNEQVKTKKTNSIKKKKK